MGLRPEVRKKISKRVPGASRPGGPKLGGRFGYFLFFSARGGGRGSPRPPGGGVVDFFLKIPGGGGSRGGGAEGPGGCLRRIGDLGGGGLNIFFRGRNVPKIERGGKTPTPKISALLRKRPVLLRANFVLTKDRKRPYYGHFRGKMHREGSCSKAAGGP